MCLRYLLSEIMKMDEAKPLHEICLPDHSGEGPILTVLRYREWNVSNFAEVSRRGRR